MNADAVFPGSNYDAVMLVNYGRSLGADVTVTGDSIIADYVRLGQSLGNAPVATGRGYYDEFGRHESFCMSCHGNTDAARLKMSAARGSVEWYLFGVDMALLATGVGEIAIAGRVVTVFRVEGMANARIIIDSAGRVIIKDGEKMLFINVGQRGRALEYLQQKIAGGLEGAQIKSFEVRKSFLDELRALAVSEAEAKVFPTRPIIVDTTKAPDQFGLRPEQIEALKRAIIQGSGKPKG